MNITNSTVMRHVCHSVFGRSVVRYALPVIVMAMAPAARATNGACCDRADGVCYDNVHWLWCVYAGLEFGGWGSTCDSMDPPCACDASGVCSSCEVVYGDDSRRARIKLLDVVYANGKTTFYYKACQKWNSPKVDKWTVELSADMCNRMIDVSADGADTHDYCEDDGYMGLYGARFRNADLPDCNASCDDNGNQTSQAYQGGFGATSVNRYGFSLSDAVATDSDSLTSEEQLMLDEVLNRSAGSTPWNPRKGIASTTDYSGEFSITVEGHASPSCGKIGLKMDHEAVYGCIKVPNGGDPQCENDFDCNDDNPCTNDICSTDGTCVNENNTDPCDDNDECTEGDVCVGGECKGTEIDCDDQNPCTTDSCDPALGCVTQNNDGGCDDDDACTSGDVCDNGECNGKPVDCDDQNPCTTDSCDPVLGCVNENNSDACDDNDACTEGDVCDGGECKGNDLDCDDQNACTTDSCDPALGCINEDNSDPCDDGDACTTGDFCEAGMCRPGELDDCDDGNPCTTDSCDPVLGCVNEDNNNGGCDDGLYCNGPENCDSGICREGAPPCVNSLCDEAGNRCVQCLSDSDCHDDDDCTTDTCTAAGECVHESIPGCSNVVCRGSTSHKGSVLVFPEIRVRWNQAGEVTEETFVHLTNDFNEDVRLHFLFVNGDDPLPAVECCDPPVVIERSHPGWNRFNWTSYWTGNESNYFALSSGLPKGAPPYAGLDNGPEGPGRPDPRSGGRILRGFLLVWAVDSSGYQLNWNHIQGGITMFDYEAVSAWEYPAYAFQTAQDAVGTRIGQVAGALYLDGRDYHLGFDRLMFDFFASSATPFPSPQPSVKVNTRVALLPLTQDLRIESEGPTRSGIRFDVWNQNEDYLSHTTRCIACWDSFFLSEVDLPNHFLLQSLQTNKGKARIEGQAMQACDEIGCCERGDTNCRLAWESETGTPAALCSEGVPLLGTSVKEISFGTTVESRGHAGSTIRGQGTRPAVILSDVPAEPEPVTALEREGRGAEGELR